MPHLMTLGQHRERILGLNHNRWRVQSRGICLRAVASPRLVTLLQPALPSRFNMLAYLEISRVAECFETRPYAAAQEQIRAKASAVSTLAYHDNRVFWQHLFSRLQCMQTGKGVSVWPLLCPHLRFCARNAPRKASSLMEKLTTRALTVHSIRAFSNGFVELFTARFSAREAA
eukprot:1931510-Pleurochrysis_carterae.AAC.1